MVLSFVAAEMIGRPVIEGSRAGIDYLGGQGNGARANKPSRRQKSLRQNHFPKLPGKTHLAATTMISTLYCGDASLASTVARAGVLPAETQPSHTAFISWKVFMSVMYI